MGRTTERAASRQIFLALRVPRMYEYWFYRLNAWWGRRFLRLTAEVNVDLSWTGAANGSCCPVVA